MCFGRLGIRLAEEKMEEEEELEGEKKRGLRREREGAKEGGNVKVRRK